MESLFNITELTSNAYLQSAVSIVGQNYIQLLLMIFGIFIYAVFVWKFYKGMSKRDLFELDLSKYNLPHMKWKRLSCEISYVIKYLVIFPLYIVMWFVLLTVFMFFLAEEVAVADILMLSVAVIAAIRVVSYYKEDLASDLAKLLPLAFLAILFTDPTVISIDTFYSRLMEAPSMLTTLAESLVFVIVLEWVLRIGYFVKVKIKGDDDTGAERIVRKK